jgi:hypothetical protein
MSTMCTIIVVMVGDDDGSDDEKYIGIGEFTKKMSRCPNSLLDLPLAKRIVMKKERIRQLLDRVNNLISRALVEKTNAESFLKTHIQRVTGDTKENYAKQLTQRSKVDRFLARQVRQLQEHETTKKQVTFTNEKSSGGRETIY